MNSSITFIKGVIANVDEDHLLECTDKMRESDYYPDWELENEMLVYLHRWIIRKHNLPLPIRARIVKWIREDKILSKFLEGLATALEKNNRDLLKEEEISI